MNVLYVFKVAKMLMIRFAPETQMDETGYLIQINVLDSCYLPQEIRLILELRGVI